MNLYVVPFSLNVEFISVIHAQIDTNKREKYVLRTGW